MAMVVGGGGDGGLLEGSWRHKGEWEEAEVNEKQSRDKNENFSYSISHIEMGREFLAINLRLRDETEKISINLRQRRDWDS